MTSVLAKYLFNKQAKKINLRGSNPYFDDDDELPPDSTTIITPHSGTTPLSHHHEQQQQQQQQQQGVPVSETQQRPKPSNRKKKQKQKKFKKIPDSVSPKNAKILAKFRRRAFRLDEQITCCFCCSFSFGYSALITLIPLVGDLISLLLSRNLIALVDQIDGVPLSDSQKGRMWMNVVVDFGLGLTPVVGTVATMIYKANTRNLKILENHLLQTSGASNRKV